MALAMVALFAVLLARDLLAVANHWDEARHVVASDYWILRDVAARWLAGGPIYSPEQLAGPYAVPGPWMLYPPPAVLFLVPLVIVPAILWWAVPIAIVVWVIIRLRPRPLVWPVMAMCLWFPTTSEVVVAGNPAMWFVAAMALGVLYGWSAALIVLKPTLAPFALWGANRRSWWLALAAIAGLSLLFLPAWPDYVTALVNMRHPTGLGYSLSQVPLMLLPIVAWLGRQPAQP